MSDIKSVLTLAKKQRSDKGGRHKHGAMKTVNGENHYYNAYTKSWESGYSKMAKAIKSNKVHGDSR